MLFICFAFSTFNYAFKGITGYLMYGDALESQITLNPPSGKISTKIAIYTTLVNPVVKYALMLAPVAEAIEHELGLRAAAAANGRALFLRILVRTALVAGTVAVAVAVPFFGEVVSLTGALLNSSVSLLLPCLCYLRLRAKLVIRPSESENTYPRLDRWRQRCAQQ